MKKIQTLFVRDFDHNPRFVTRQVTPGCEWVVDGEGTATRKWDGTCVRLDADGRWWARREVKRGKNPPHAFQVAEIDETTGKQVGWEPAEQSPFAKFLEEATADIEAPGTYELVGPKINGNPEGFDRHTIVGHGWMPTDVADDFSHVPTDYEGLAAWLSPRPYEGIVWHHPDGRMVKIKRRDFPAGG